MSQGRTPMRNPGKAPAPHIHRSGALDKDAHTEKSAVPVPKGFPSKAHTPEQVPFKTSHPHD